MSLDDIGDRMKIYESVETSRKLDPSRPIYARIDGKGFSSFTRGMNRPFDERMTAAMIEVTKFLVKETHAVCGYVQSDEISLAWPDLLPPSSMIFDGKVQKLASVLASLAADRMNKVIRGWSPYEDRTMAFDCRIINLPDRSELANMFLWRSIDATKNAISMAARAYHSPKQLHGKSSAEMRTMLADKGVDFSAYPESFRNGTFVKRMVRTFEAVNQATGIAGDVTRAEIVPVSFAEGFRALPHAEREAVIFEKA